MGKIYIRDLHAVKNVNGDSMEIYWKSNFIRGPGAGW
jgi:hypothetical protein